MQYNIMIDADSMLYTAAYRHRENPVVEMMFAEFCYMVLEVKNAVWDILPETSCMTDKPTVEMEIVLSPKKSFRHQIFPEYKANRKQSPLEGLSELRHRVMERLSPILVENFEADDVVVHGSNVLGYFVGAIDKDVINACRQPVYNYVKRAWEHQGRTQSEIEEWYNYQALMGDSGDGIPGAKGVGKVGAKKIVATHPNWEEYAANFPDEDTAVTMMRLVRMDQFDGGKIIFWAPSLFYQAQSF